jgi:hypothetical protein
MRDELSRLSDPFDCLEAAWLFLVHRLPHRAMRIPSADSTSLSVTAAGLPRASAFVSVAATNDWLLDAMFARAAVQRGANDRELVLDNGLLRGRFASRQTLRPSAWTTHDSAPACCAPSNPGARHH